MKKYLIGGTLALIAGLFVTSCTHDDVYDNSDIVQKRTEDFQKAFVKAYGQIASNQGWGFDRTEEYETTPVSTRIAKARKAGTRTPAEFGWEVSGDYNRTFDKAYYDYVFTWLQEEVSASAVTNNYEFLSTGPFQFSVIFSNTSGDDEVGYYYYNDDVNNRVEVPFINHLGWGEAGGGYQYFVKFKKPNGEVVAASPTAGHDVFNWGCTSSIAKTVTINVPADYYVGFYIKQGSNTMYSNESLNNDQRPAGKRFYSAVLTKNAAGEYIVGLEDWHFTYSADGHVADCNDVVLAVSPISDTPPTIVEPGGDEIPREPVITYGYEYGYEDVVVENTKRIFCEDLGSDYSTRADFDYNDVVFDATIVQRTYHMVTKTYKDGVLDDEDTDYNVVKPAGGNDGDTEEQEPRYFAKIELFAAGGTKPLSIFGVEVHAAYQVGLATMVNTFDENSKRHTSTDSNGQTTSAFGSYTYVENPIELTNPTPPEMKTNEEASDSDFPRERLFEMTCKTTEDGTKIIPKILDIPIIARISDNAVTELNSYRGNAPHMIAVPVNQRWPSERYDIAEAYPNFSTYVSGGAEPWSNGDPNCICESTPSLSSYIKGDSQVSTTSSGGVTEKVYYSNETGYNLDERSFYFANTNILSGLADGDRIRVHVKDVSDGYILNLSNGNSDRLVTDQSQLAGKSSGYIDFGMSQYIINSLNSGSGNAALILSGTKVTVTGIGVVKK